jgi:HAD superfamily hydrolase (TIGR01509 family)
VLFVNPQAVVFDWDGTVVDSHPLTTSVWEAQLAAYGIVAPNHDIESLFGMGWPAAYDWLCTRFSMPPPSVVAHHLRERRAKHIHRLGLFTDVPGCIEALRAADVRTALATNSSAARFAEDAEVVGLPRDWFDVVVTASDVARPKPFPDIHLAAADRLGCSTSHSVAIEDASFGERAATDAGFAVVRVERRNTMPAHLLPSTLLVDTLSAPVILRFVGRS